MVTPVYEGKSALEAINDNHYDLMVLDIMVTEVNGLSVLKAMPDDRQLPVIMLTAKADEIDRIIGLELGADDYVSKPCNPRELVARIHAVLKRSQSRRGYDNEISQLPDSLFCLDHDKRTFAVNGEMISLTGTEFDLLFLLLKHKGKLIDKATLSEEILQRELQPFDRSIDVHISRLRKRNFPCIMMSLLELFGARVISLQFRRL